MAVHEQYFPFGIDVYSLNNVAPNGFNLYFHVVGHCYVILADKAHAKYRFRFLPTMQLTIIAYRVQAYCGILLQHNHQLIFVTIHHVKYLFVDVDHHSTFSINDVPQSYCHVAGGCQQICATRNRYHCFYVVFMARKFIQQATIVI